LTLVPPSHRQRVRDTIASALSFDPAARPSSAGTFANALRPPPPPNNLPVMLSSFVGRSKEIAHGRSLLSTTRFVTITGPGGSGKTRLALEVAAGSVLTFDGAWFVELANVAEDAVVVSRVAAAVGAQTRAADSAFAAVVDELTSGRHLLILDNCEHVTRGCSQLANELLSRCPELVILATSREPLRTVDECVHVVGALARDEGIALFRARAPYGVRIADADEPLIARICERLDGIPLAIELAAAQLGPLDVASLHAALDEALGVLAGGARTNPRHATMRATIEWSADRLEPDARAALARLCVFAGGFTRGSAEVVCGAGRFLDTIVRSSLLSADGERFRLLETVRQFAAGELPASEVADLRDRHARWVAELDTDRSDEAEARLRRLAAEHDNIEAALTHTVTVDPPLAARIVLEAMPYWMRRDWNTGRRWAARILQVGEGLDGATLAALHMRAADLVGGDLAEALGHRECAVATARTTGDGSLLAMALTTLGGTAAELGDVDQARRCFAEAIDVHRSIGRTKGFAIALSNLSALEERIGNVPASVAALENAIDIFRELPPSDPDADFLGNALHNLAVLHEHGDDWDAARTCYEDALVVFDRLRNEYGRGYVLHALAYVDHRQGRSGTARARIQESLEIAVRLGDRTSEAQALQFIGDLHRPDDLEEALDHHRRAVEIHREVGSPLPIAYALARMAFVEVQSGNAAAAARAFGEAEAWYEAAGSEPFVNADVDEEVAWMRETLGPDIFDREWQLGRAAASRA
jgi:non-specific serine/threonine protein kinase